MDLTRKQMLGGLGGIIAAGVAPSVLGGALHHGVALREQTMVGGGIVPPAPHEYEGQENLILWLDGRDLLSAPSTVSGNYWQDKISKNWVNFYKPDYISKTENGIGVKVSTSITTGAPVARMDDVHNGIVSLFSNPLCSIEIFARQTSVNANQAPFLIFGPAVNGIALTCSTSMYARVCSSPCQINADAKPINNQQFYICMRRNGASEFTNYVLKRGIDTYKKEGTTAGTLSYDETWRLGLFSTNCRSDYAGSQTIKSGMSVYTVRITTDYLTDAQIDLNAAKDFSIYGDT